MDINPRSPLLYWYFQKERQLGEEDKNKTVVIRLTVKKKKRWISLPLKSRKKEFLESMCRLLPFCEWWNFSVSLFQNASERTWNAGTIHWETVNHYKFLKARKRKNKVRRFNVNDVDNLFLKHFKKSRLCLDTAGHLPTFSSPLWLWKTCMIIKMEMNNQGYFLRLEFL